MTVATIGSPAHRGRYPVRRPSDGGRDALADVLGSHRPSTCPGARGAKGTVGDMSARLSVLDDEPSAPAEEDPYLLRGMLRCAGCGNEVFPEQILGAPRRYACRSGCRMVPLPAEALEERVWRTACRLGASRTARSAAATRAALIGQTFSRITVGGTVSDLRVVLRAPVTGAG